MKNWLVIFVFLVTCAFYSKYDSRSTDQLKVNGVHLGMSRAEVDRLFGKRNRTNTSVTEYFLKGPEKDGGERTDIRFNSSAYEARVIEVGGRTLSLGDQILCQELWGEQVPDPRPTEVKRMLGEPDVVLAQKTGDYWYFRGYALSVYTGSSVPWYFCLTLPNEPSS